MILVIYYIKNEVDGAYIYPNKRRSGYTAFGVVKKICLKHLTTFEAYLKTVRLIMPDRYKIPIVLSSRYAFFSTRSYKDIDSIWINYMEIKEIVYLRTSIIFIFDEKYELNIEMTTKNYQRLVSIIFKVLKYRESLD